MRSPVPVGLVILLAAVVLAGSACRIPGGSAGSSPQPSTASNSTSSPAAPSVLDPAVQMPAGFPSDVPIYTGARLTAAASFTSNGQTAWGMEWETLDTVDKVQAFYAGKFSQGDWTIKFNAATAGAFSAVFSRKSNPKVGGILGADGSSGVTKIALSLASAS